MIAILCTRALHRPVVSAKPDAVNSRSIPFSDLLGFIKIFLMTAAIKNYLSICGHFTK